MEMRSVINRPKPIRPWRITHVELLHRSKPKHAILREGGKYILPDYAEKYTKPWAEIRWWDNTSSLCPSWFLNAHHQHFLPSPAQPQPAPHSTAWALPFHQYPQLCRSPPSSNSSRYMSPLKTPGADTLGPSVSAPGPKKCTKPGADTLGPSVSAPGFFGGAFAHGYTRVCGAVRDGRGSADLGRQTGGLAWP